MYSERLSKGEMASFLEAAHPDASVVENDDYFEVLGAYPRPKAVLVKDDIEQYDTYVDEALTYQKEGYDPVLALPVEIDLNDPLQEQAIEACSNAKIDLISTTFPIGYILEPNYYF